MAAASSNRTTVSSSILHYREDSFSDSDLSSSDDASSCDSESDTSSSERNAVLARKDWQGAVSKTGELFYIRALRKDADGNIADRGSRKAGAPLRGGLHGLLRGEKRRKRSPDTKGHGRHSDDVIRLVAGARKEVWIQVDPTRPRNLGRRATTAESVFGLVVDKCRPAHVDFEEDNEQDNDVMPSVVIKGLVPGGPALNCGQVRVGDWLRRVDETDVTMANLERTLTSIIRPRKVKLILHSLYKAPLTSRQDPREDQKPMDIPFLAKLLTGENTSWEHLSFTVANIPHAVMYLDLASVGGESDQPSEATKKSDIVYHFPKINSKLVSVRGIFMTLFQLVNDVTGSPALRTALMIDDHFIHVSYVKDDDCLFIMAIPFICAPWGQLQQVTTDLCRVLRFQYGSLSKAFSNGSNHAQLDQLFAIAFRRCFIDEWQNTDVAKMAQQNFSSLQDVFGSVPVIPVPLDTKVIINDIISEFSSADWGEMSEDRYEMRRLYSILGCCIYYKGHVLASHLTASDLREVSLFIRACGILELSKSPCLAETVIWREVYPSGHRNQTKIPYRWFILIVGLNQCLMTVLLESGGCAANATDNTGPDPFYVDQARNTLLHLETTDVLCIAEAWFQGNSWPPLADMKAIDVPSQSKKMFKPNERKVDRSMKELPKSLSTTSLNTLQNTRLKKSSSSEFYPQGLLAPVGGEVDSDSTSLTLTASDDGRRDSWTTYGSDVDSRDGSEGAIYKVSQSSRWLPSLSDLAGRSGNPKNRDLPSLKLTNGPINGLFHYVSLDTEEGILLCPPEQQLESCIFQDVIDNFRLCTLAIRRLLNSAVDVPLEQSDGKSGFVIDNTFGSVREHGVLFQCCFPQSADPTKVTKQLNYWVVGRLFKSTSVKEVYVCYQDLTPQNLIEMAFKLAAGVLV